MGDVAKVELAERDKAALMGKPGRPVVAAHAEICWRLIEQLGEQLGAS
jgi:hypothetical protein